MSYSNLMQFYTQLEQTALNNIEEIDLNATMRRIHLLQKNEPQYKQILLEMFNYGLASRNYDEHIKIGFWFAEIYNLDPEYSHLFPAFRNSFYTGAIENMLHNDSKLEKLSTMAARLIDYSHLHVLLKELKTIVTQGNQYSKYVTATLDLINEVMIWQIDRKAIYLRGRRYQVFKMIKNILKEFKQMPDLNTQKFIPQKIKILHSIILYLQSQNSQKNKLASGQILSFKTAIIEELESYEVVPLQIQDQAKFFDLTDAAIKIFGIYDQTRIERFLAKYKCRTANISYLRLFKTLAERSNQKISPRIKQMIDYTIQILISKFFSTELKNFSELFETLKTKSDIIIEKNKINFVNLTKHLSQCLGKVFISYHKMFLTSLLIIYNPTVRTAVSKEFAEYQSVFYHNKHQTIYYQMIQYFASIEFHVQQYFEDPETRENLVWGLLALRNSIKVNYYFLSQKNFVPIIYRNLVKLMLANVSSKQCRELAEELLNKNLNSEDTWKQIMNYGTIIAQFQQFAFTITIEALSNFSSLLKKHIQIFGQDFFQDLQLFKQLCILGTKIMQKMNDQKQQLKLKFIQIIFSVLRDSIPGRNLDNINVGEIYEARDSLITLMSLDQKYALYSIYIDFAFAFREHQTFNALIGDSRITKKQILQHLDVLIYRKLEIMSHISNNIELSFERVQMFWPNFIQGITSRDKDLGLYFLLLNQYILNNFKKQVKLNSGLRQQYILFLRFQLVQLKSFLNIIQKQIQEQSLVSSLQNLLEISTALSLNLEIVLTEVQKYEEIKDHLQDKLLDLCHSMLKWFKIMERIASQQFMREEKGLTVSLWRSSYTYLIMIASLSYQMCKRAHLEINFSYEVMKKKLQFATNNISQIERHKFDLFFSELFAPQVQDYVNWVE